MLSQHRKEIDGRIKDRIKVLLWHDEGKTIEEIVHLLYLSLQTIKVHITEYEDQQNLKLTDTIYRFMSPNTSNKILL